jgi:hypothetical protein
MTRSFGGGWAVAGTFLLFVISVGVYLAAPSLFPAGEASVEKPHVPLPAGPHKNP